ncbi:MAG TPA: PEP-CTERM sorting domain-containing protein [Vicinamibacterales bacterium]|nr:PEP-CTERM sorting domain-containing protein [Vicinamibacterales bacterium]
MRRRSIRLACVAALCSLAVLLAPPRAGADPIWITSGSIYFDTGDPPYFNLAAPGLLLAGVVTHGNWSGFQDIQACGFACPEGTTIAMTTTFGRVDEAGTPGPFGFGGATVDGVTYENPGGIDVWFLGALTFSAPPVTVGGGDEYYRSPFSMSGRLVGYAPTELVASPPADLALWGVPLFDLELEGNGVATLRTFEPVDGRYTFLALSYDFSPEPIPEPGTLLLVGGGLALALRRRRR